MDSEKLNKILEGMPFKLTEEQYKFIVNFISGKGHYSLLGDAGSGKTTIMWVLKQYYGDELVATGTTGSATINLPNEMGVCTTHSLFNIPVGIAIDSDLKKRPHDLLSSSDLIKIIVVDEAFFHSSQELFFYLHQIKKLNRATRKRSSRDIRLLLVGDVLQAPTITTNKQEQAYKELYGSHLMFRSHLWKEANIQSFVLKEVKRQTGDEPKDIWFRKALQVIRYGYKEHYNKVCEGLNKKCVGDNFGEDSIYIAPTNNMVNNYNEAYLERNPNRKMTFEVVFEAKYNKKSFPLDWEVTLAEGCKIITLVNKPELGFQNGTVLTVTAMSTEGVYGTKSSGEEVFVPIHEFKEEEVYTAETIKDGVNTKVQKRRHVASAYMLPCKLCAGFSCARVQGRTFNTETVVDFGSDRQSWMYTKPEMGDFMTAGAFVALSRVTNIDHLKLKNKIYPHHIKVCEESRDFWFECLRGG